MKRTILVDPNRTNLRHFQPLKMNEPRQTNAEDDGGSANVRFRPIADLVIIAFPTERGRTNLQLPNRAPSDHLWRGFFVSVFDGPKVTLALRSRPLKKAVG